MKNHLSCILRLCIVTTILLTSYASSSFGQERVVAELPIGDWTFTAVPSDKQSSDVVVYSVTTEAYKGLAVTKIGLHNRSNKVATSVKLLWQLLRVDDKETDQFVKISSDESPVLGVSISPGERRIIDFPVVKFTDILKSYSKEDQPTGSFRLELSVVDASFGSSAKDLGDQNEPTDITKVSSQVDTSYLLRCQNSNSYTSALTLESIFVKASFNLIDSASEQCQHQICQWNGQTKEGCFMCQGLPNFGCQVSSCQSCTNTHCG